MLALTLLVASIAVADSINPSTVVPALWLAGAQRDRGLGSYTLGVFAVYLAGGVVLVFGPGAALIAVLHHIGGPVEHALQVAVGIVAVAFAAALWRSRGRLPTEPAPRRGHARASTFALGAGIMALELPTAFIYFGAISAILSAHPGAPVELSLLITYNALFVAPLVAIIVVRRLAGERADRLLAAGEAWLRGVGQIVLSAAAGAAGAVLIVLGVSGFLAA